jgi:hypothetical protein
MSDQKDTVLPHRTTAEDVTRLVEARARGRDLSQIQSLNFSAHGFQGALIAAYEFELLDPTTKDLTKAGRDYALATPTQKSRLFLHSMLKYEPYELLLEAIFDRGNQKETALEWIETWWSTHKYGNSQTNRDEGASTLARFIEFVGLGAYIQGRKGYSTRIEWRDHAVSTIKEIMRGDNGKSEQDNNGDTTNRDQPLAPQPMDKLDKTPAVKPNDPPILEGNNSHLVLNLGVGRRAEISLPPKVTSAEKKRLVALIELMIDVDDELDASPNLVSIETQKLGSA